MRTSARIAAAALAAALLARPAPARAEPRPDPKREVAVLEFRGGSTEMPKVASRAARLLNAQTSLRLVQMDEARQKHPDLDGDLAACAGQPPCLADLGTALGVDEVLVVGVSEFGDVILAIQRIDVENRRVSGRMAEAIAPGEPPNDAALLSYLRRVFPKGDFRRFGSIRIRANVRGAAVRVGSKERGTTPLSPLRVPAPASYRIEVNKPGYVGFEATVAVPPDGEVEVRPELAEEASRPWYQKWWVLAIAGSVAVGAGTAAVMATRDDGGGGVDVRIAPF